MHWFFTPVQVENLLHEVGLTPADYQLTVYGNLLAKMRSCSTCQPAS
jgi:hypothetical protein